MWELFFEKGQFCCDQGIILTLECDLLILFQPLGIYFLILVGPKKISLISSNCWMSQILGKKLNQTPTRFYQEYNVNISDFSPLYPRLSMGSSSGSEQYHKPLWSQLNSGMLFMFSFPLGSVRMTNSSPLLAANNALMELHRLQELCPARAFAKSVSVTFWSRASTCGEQHWKVCFTTEQTMNSNLRTCLPKQDLQEMKNDIPDTR